MATVTKLAIVGDIDPSTSDWTSQVAAAAQRSFAETAIYHYLHWQAQTSPLDMEEEASHLARLVSGWRGYAILAKSAGALVALKSIKDRLIRPDRCIFVGTPVNLGRANGLPVDSWFDSYAVPTMFVHNTDDPALSSRELQHILELRNAKDHVIVELDGQTHQYNDVAHLGQLVTQFVLDP